MYDANAYEATNDTMKTVFGLEPVRNSDEIGDILGISGRSVRRIMEDIEYKMAKLRRSMVRYRYLEGSEPDRTPSEIVDALCRRWEEKQG